MSNWWSIFVIVLVVGNIIGVIWLLFATNRPNDKDDKATTGHCWDDDLTELNNPLPRWWLWLFLITIIFSVFYLALYPGLGNYPGMLNWTQTKQYNQAKLDNERQKKQTFAKYEQLDINQLAANQSAMQTAGRLFSNYCSTCHGADGNGAKGFPNLADDDWLYGNTPEQIHLSIANGRAGIMPSLNLDNAKVLYLANYVLSLSGEETLEYPTEKGEALYPMCVGCHGVDGKGNQALGAPNLTDDIWLYGKAMADIQSVIKNGRQGNMPAHKTLLTEDEIRLLTAYVLSLSENQTN